MCHLPLLLKSSENVLLVLEVVYNAPEPLRRMTYIKRVHLDCGAWALRVAVV